MEAIAIIILILAVALFIFYQTMKMHTKELKTALRRAKRAFIIAKNYSTLERNPQSRIVVMAKVTGRYIAVVNGREKAEIVYTFTARDKKDYRGSILVTKADWKLLEEPVLPIAYLLENPNINVPDDENIRKQFNLARMIIAAIVLAPAVGWLLYFKISRAHF
jgi:hypothetical protein